VSFVKKPVPCKLSLTGFPELWRQERIEIKSLQATSQFAAGCDSCILEWVSTIPARDDHEARIVFRIEFGMRHAKGAFVLAPASNI
jgi:hypothetical protein